MFKLEYAMPIQVSVSLDVSRFKSFCALGPGMILDLRQSLVLSRDTNTSVSNVDKSGISGLFRGALKSGTPLFYVAV